jgi:hypothetical protein
LSKQYAYLLSEKIVANNTDKDNYPEFKTCGVYDIAAPVSNLPKPPASQRSSAGRTKYTTLLKWQNKKSRDRRSNWAPVKYDLSLGGIYVTVDRFNCIVPSGNSDLWHCLDWISEITKQSPPFELFGIRLSDLKKLDKHKGKWTELKNYVIKLLGDNKELVKLATANSQWINLNSRDSIKELTNKTYKAGSVFGQLVKDCKEILALLNKQVKQRDAVSCLNTRFGLGLLKDVEALENKRTEVWKHYPMLEISGLNSYSIKPAIEPIYDYITLIDKVT